MSDCNSGINCNVEGCVYNECGCKCNLDKVSISKGSGDHHFCKSYISKNCEADCQCGCQSVPSSENQTGEQKLTVKKTSNVESGEEEYFDYSDLIDDIEDVDKAPKKNSADKIFE